MLPLFDTPPQYMKIVEYPHYFYELIGNANSPSRRLFDDWITCMEGLYQLPSDTPLKVLTYAPQLETSTFTYALQKSQALIRRYPQHPKMRLAVLIPQSQGVFSRVLSSLAEMLRTGDEIRTMYGDKREEAVAWLFAKEPENRP